jgi:hypothetical protein
MQLSLVTTKLIRYLTSMQATMNDDARYALLAKAHQARNMTPQAKFFAGSELFEEACAWTLAGITDQYPDATEAEKLQELRRRLGLTENSYP